MTPAEEMDNFLNLLRGVCMAIEFFRSVGVEQEYEKVHVRSILEEPSCYATPIRMREEKLLFWLDVTAGPIVHEDEPLLYHMEDYFVSLPGDRPKILRLGWNHQAAKLLWLDVTKNRMLPFTGDFTWV